MMLNKLDQLLENTKKPIYLDIRGGYISFIAIGLLMGSIGGGGAIHYASYRGYEDIVKLLVEAGADVNLETEEEIISKYIGMRYWTPVALAKEHKKLQKYLRSKGAK